MAEMRPMRDYLPLVMPHVPGCPEIMAERAVRSAIIEFCERTRCWRYIWDVEMTHNGRAVLPFPFATVHEFETASWGDREAPLTPTQFSDIDPTLRAMTPASGGVPVYITQVEDNTVAVYPPADGTLHVTMFLKPMPDQMFVAHQFAIADYYDQAPGFIFRQNAECIAHGAIARLMLTPKQEFTDLKLGQYHAEKFEAGITDKFSHNMTGQQRAPRRTRFSDF